MKRAYVLLGIFLGVAGCTTRTNAVIEGQCGELLPDVVVTELSYADGIFTCRVENRGTAATPDGIVVAVGYSVDGRYQTWGSVGEPLAPGESVVIGTRGGAFVIPDGTHEITADVDDVDRFAELDETNNQLSRSITVCQGSTGDCTGEPRAIGPRSVAPTPVERGTLFAAPAGSGTACTKTAPCDLWEATRQAVAGDVVFMRGGVYDVRRKLVFAGRGTSPSPVIFESYPGELAVLEGDPDGIQSDYVRVAGDPVILRRFDVRRMPRRGISVISSGHVLEGIRAYDNRLSGIQVIAYDVASPPNGVVIRDCAAYDNSAAGLSDPVYADGGNSDGISVSEGADIRIENCLVFGNSDDGIDLWGSTDAYVGYSIAYGNGLASGDGDGFKAGGDEGSAGAHVEHCLSFRNKRRGFDYNTSDDVVFRYNTSWANPTIGFFSDASTRLEHNIAGEVRPFGGGGVAVDNSWQRSGMVTFVSTDIDSPDLLRPAPGSGFEDIGAYANRE